jgi:tetratricopeptide (TPR) repeat protein
VQTAAVLGREFELLLLSYMLRDEHELPEMVTEAEKASIWMALNEIRYIFRHGLLRDAAYDMQLRTRRQALHELAMSGLENLFAASEKARYGELAYHAERAGLMEKALLYLQKAGDAAGDAYEHSQAIDYYSRALPLVREVDWETRYELLLAREEIWHLQGNRDKQRNELGALQQVAKDSGQLHCQAEVALRRARYAGAIGDFNSAIDAARDAVDMALEVGHADKASRGYRLWGWYLFRQIDYDEALLRLQQSLEQARGSGEVELEADSFNSLGALFAAMGEHARALEHYQDARDLYQQVDNQIGVARTWNNQGAVEYELREFDKAIANYEQALDIRRQIGDRRGEGNTLNNLGGARRALGHYVSARACYEESLAIRRQIDDRRGAGLALLSLGLLASNLGDYAKARADNKKSLEIFRAVGDRMLITYTLLNLGSYEIDEGHYAEAEMYYQSALELGRETGREHEIVLAEEGLGWTRLGQNQLDEAADFFQHVIAAWRKKDASQRLVHAQSGLARVALAQGELTQALNLVEEILAYLDARPLSDDRDPFGVYLACVEVLRAARAPRSATVLKQAYASLQERAARINDKTMRHCYLHNVPNHRQLVLAYQDLERREAVAGSQLFSKKK